MDLPDRPHRLTQHKTVPHTTPHHTTPHTDEGVAAQLTGFLDNARSLVKSLFFNARRYDLGSVGRYKLNRKLDLSIPQGHRTLTLADLVSIIRRLIQLKIEREAVKKEKAPKKEKETKVKTPKTKGEAPSREDLTKIEGIGKKIAELLAADVLA